MLLCAQTVNLIHSFSTPRQAARLLPHVCIYCTAFQPGCPSEHTPESKTAAQQGILSIIHNTSRHLLQPQAQPEPQLPQHQLVPVAPR